MIGVPRAFWRAEQRVLLVEAHVVLTESTMMELGVQAPDFTLPDPVGKVHSLSDFGGAKALLVAFICNHCPYVIQLKQPLADFAQDYSARGLAVVAINSNDAAAYPADAPDKMRQDIDSFGYCFPYLIDESQTIARAYGAACTPDFYLFDGARNLAYHGQFDAARPGGGTAVTGADLKAAADAVLSDEDYTGPQTPSVGCSIKWKPGS